MATFHRARSEEQRAARRTAILDVAATMLGEQPVAELSLNALARRVGLAKSNVLRYFDSREAILLELLTAQSTDWLAELSRLPKPRGAVSTRSRRLTTAIAESLARRPVLCDLIGSQAAVLERNVSVEVAARHKRASLAAMADFGAIVRRALPELDDETARLFAAATQLTAGALWVHAQPTEVLRAVYDAHPDLAVFKIDFVADMQRFLSVVLAGLLAQNPS
ncbi:TetR/AcrR family transcriptional regulator [Microlunatus parietis]|uniref:AcrR family transcriptional regulator n=1 Tax=Microlunatus parietis TaxID=682979 RepID=A0A7Y9I921_9ACTN|nr:TetR family transcriptional regulator [Microlunatus parietis]NYE72186.1 AcrR family transcriptional regulator [Microlunatus parietis]